MAVYVVTGGGGFIGSHIVEELLRRGETESHRRFLHRETRKRCDVRRKTLKSSKQISRTPGISRKSSTVPTTSSIKQQYLPFPNPYSIQ